MQDKGYSAFLLMSEFSGIPFPITEITAGILSLPVTYPGIIGKVHIKEYYDIRE
jgi:hypothetical protein